MKPQGTDEGTVSSGLSVAIQAMEEAGSLMELPPMVQEGPCEQPEAYPGAYVWLTGRDRTLLMGVQCESLAKLGMAFGDEGEEAHETGVDGLGEILNVAAGLTKGKVAETDKTVSLGLPVMATGPICPRSSLSKEAMGLRFGDLSFVVSIIEMNLSPEALARKEEEEKNQKLRQELQLAQKLEAVGQLAAGVAHEINTPLQFVGDNIGFLKEAFTDLSVLIEALGMMQERFEREDHTKALALELDGLRDNADADFLLESVPEALDTVHRGIERVGKVVQALRNVGSAGLMTRQPIEINELIESTLVVTCSHYEAIAEVQHDLGEVPRIDADPGQLSQVFIHLFINAAEAIQAIADRTPQGERGTIRVSTRHEDGEVIVEISDTGCGVPEEIRDRIFDPFFTTKGVGKNMGQGLSTVRTIIVEGHDGKMDVESEVGKGTRFTLRLPVRAPEVSGSQAA